MYQTYKITNWVDNRYYYGSTKLSLATRMHAHRAEANRNNPKHLSEWMRMIGIDNFKIETVEYGFSDKTQARVAEQKLIDEADRNLLVNQARAYSHNHNQTRDQDKLKAKKKRYYYRKRNDPEWLMRQQEKTKLRMRERRESIKQNNVELLNEIRKKNSASARLKREFHRLMMIDI